MRASLSRLFTKGRGTMIEKSRVIDVLLMVADDINRQVSKEKRIERSPNTVLLGKESVLDSLGLINFILMVEQRIEETFHCSIVLTEDDLLTFPDGPFRTIGSLSEYIAKQI